MNLDKSNKPTLVLMTRWHAIHRCKSRLSKDIGAFKAAKIQEKLTNHTINVAKEVQKKGRLLLLHLDYPEKLHPH